MLALTPLLALAQITLQGSLSHRDSAGLWPGVAHALRDEAKFLYVRGDFSRVGGKRAVQSPTPGGRAQTKFVAVDIDDFEANCRDYLSRYAAVVSTYDSACLNGVKHQADYFIRDDGFTFYLNRGERRGIEADLLRDAAAGNRAWEVKGAGAFEYAIEEGDSGLTLVVEALRDMPWLSVALPARRLGNRRYHELEVEASAPAGVRTNIGYWNYEGKSAPIHFARAFSAGNRQSLPLRFGADRGRDYVYVDAIGIKAGQEFRVHRLRLYSSDWRREF